MNKRIQQLVNQAGDYVNEVYTGPVRSKTPGKIWEDGHVGWHTQFNEKFAELIVRECANLFEIEYGTSEVSGNEVARVLQRHFGVEE
jgi:hypothetical protein